MKKIINSILFTLLIVTAFGQSNDPRVAKEFFKNNNFFRAAHEYKRLITQFPDEGKYYFQLGICYLSTFEDKTRSLELVIKAKELKYKDKELPYYLGLSYAMNLDYDNALTSFKEYAESPGKNDEMVNLWISNCSYAQELIANPVSVHFQNLGPQINSKYSDYYPFISKDETIIAYNSRRKENKGRIEFDGYYPTDIYLSTYDGSKYSKAKNVSEINTNFDDQIVGISDDGQYLVIYADQMQTGRDLYISKRSSATSLAYSRKKRMKEHVNAEKSLESSGSISNDYNTIFFSSDRPGGTGGLDLYMVRKLPNGKWAKPQNLGPNINTEYDEDFPTISEDGKTLYFSSEGLPGMGGFDLFKSTWNQSANTWSKPENLGYPINGPQDERTISITKDQKRAYISATRKGGYGELDIYRLTFLNVDVNPALFDFTIVDATSDKKIDPIVTIFGSDDEIFGEYLPNSNGTYTIILPVGAYSIEIMHDGYEDHFEPIKVNEFMHRIGKIEQIIKLKPQ